jgi:flagellar hook-length control protein FliK
MVGPTSLLPSALSMTSTAGSPATDKEGLIASDLDGAAWADESVGTESDFSAVIGAFFQQLSPETLSNSTQPEESTAGTTESLDEMPIEMIAVNAEASSGLAREFPWLTKPLQAMTLTDGAVPHPQNVPMYGGDMIAGTSIEANTAAPQSVTPGDTSIVPETDIPLPSVEQSTELLVGNQVPSEGQDGEATNGPMEERADVRLAQAAGTAAAAQTVTTGSIDRNPADDGQARSPDTNRLAAMNETPITQRRSDALEAMEVESANAASDDTSPAGVPVDSIDSLQSNSGSQHSEVGGDQQFDSPSDESEATSGIDVTGGSDPTNHATTQTTSGTAFRTDQELSVEATRQVSESIRMLVVNEPDLPARVEVELDPPELGKVTVELTDSDRGVTARIHAARESTAALLDQQITQLRQMLEDAGVTVSDFQVTYDFNQSGREAYEQESGVRDYWTKRFRETAQPEGLAPSATTPARNDGHVDIRI